MARAVHKTTLGYTFDANLSSDVVVHPVQVHLID